MSNGLMTQVKQDQKPIPGIFTSGNKKTVSQQKYLTTLRLYENH
jgi:hypothetical protein